MLNILDDFGEEKLRLDDFGDDKDTQLSEHRVGASCPSAHRVLTAALLAYRRGGSIDVVSEP